MWDSRSLQQQQIMIDTLIVYSHDMSLYTVQACINGEQRPLAEDGKVLTFRSIEHLRKRLASLKVSRCVLVQHSPYQEMVGQAAPVAPPMELELAWPGWQAASQH